MDNPTHTISVSLRQGPEQKFMDSIVTMFGVEQDALECFGKIRELMYPDYDSWQSQGDGWHENISPEGETK